MKIVLNRLALVLFAGFLTGLCGCAANLYDPPAVFKSSYDQPSYPALRPGQVYFFLSKDAFPPDLQSIAMGTLFTPEGSQWSAKRLVQEFQTKAAGIGANAVVFEGVQAGKMLFGYFYYTGYATAYRLYQENPAVDADLSSTQYGTQDPDLVKVQMKAVPQQEK